MGFCGQVQGELQRYGTCHQLSPKERVDGMTLTLVAKPLRRGSWKPCGLLWLLICKPHHPRPMLRFLHREVHWLKFWQIPIFSDLVCLPASLDSSQCAIRTGSYKTEKRNAESLGHCFKGPRSGCRQDPGRLGEEQTQLGFWAGLTEVLNHGFYCWKFSRWGFNHWVALHAFLMHLRHVSCLTKVGIA